MRKNNNIYIISSFFVLASLSLVIFCVWPLLNEIKKNSEDLVSLKDNVATIAAQTAEIESFKKNYSTYRPNLEKIDKLFVDSTNPVDFIKFLEDTALSCQIVSKISLPASSQTSQQVEQNFFVFQFFSKGNFSDVLIFLKKIELGPYLTEIENLTIQNLDNNEDKSVLKDYFYRKVEAVFTIKAFVKK